ncbi:hypothetical protein Tco_0029893, partial [Tanacetum coccineum]
DVNVTFRRNPDPPSGLFLERMSLTNTSESYSCDFVPLDNRIPLLATNFTFGPKTYYKKYGCGGGVKMAFDPSKSPHYKVIYAEIVERDMDDMDDMMVQLPHFLFRNRAIGCLLVGINSRTFFSSISWEENYWKDALIGQSGGVKIFIVSTL